MKKIIGIFICMLLMIPVLSTTVIANPEPIIEIGDIRGRTTLFYGAILIFEIKNSGDADAKDVIWNFAIKHPIIKKFNLSHDFTIDLIKAGDIKKLTVGLSWWGRFELTITAYIPGGTPVSKTVNGFSIFIFIIIFPK
ncbi:hypothetical protein AYK20_06075 [Thermoplasmatales archaeon SG8-52-1]|nr:MAG: hypothetical protein AYK20_06075 [Thermoplasmatales archaeon SG8-52-1]